MSANKEPKDVASNADWHKRFFTGIVVDMWRQAMPPEATATEVEFLESELKLRRGQRVLDVPCGHGRHSIELAHRGYRMTAIDGSEEMIAAAKGDAKEAGVKIDFHVRDMRELGGFSSFHAAFCFGNSFGYLDRKGMRAFLGAVSRVLKPGARFAFDYGMAAECILPRFTAREWLPLDELYFLEQNDYHVEEGCVETTYTFMRDGSIETRTGLHWVYTVAEVREMLTDAGFGNISIYGSHSGDPFSLGTHILVGVAEKLKTR